MEDVKMGVDKDRVIAMVKEMKTIFLDSESSRKITEKGLADYVTEVDFTVQSVLCGKLQEAYPEIQFMGEEKDNSDIDITKPFWILDPVDGTTNLIHGFRLSAISLALCEGGKLVMGIIYQPYTDELFYAEAGKGAFLNGDSIHVSSAKTMGDSLISIGTSPYRHDLADANFEAFKKIFLDSQDIRRMGSAAIELAYVACGRSDAFFERNLKPWDYAAGVVLVREAGGNVTAFDGGEVALDKPCDIVAGNGVINELIRTGYLG